MSEGQIELDLALTEVERMEREGRWPDLSRLEQRKPDQLKFAVYLLSFRVPFREVSKVTGLHTNTLQMIADHPVYGRALLAQKQRVAATRRFAIELGTANMLEQFARGKYDPLGLKLLWDMEQIESGNPTSRHEVIDGQAVSDADDYARMVAAARTARPVGMILEAEEIPTKDARLALEGESASLDAIKAFMKPKADAPIIDTEEHNDS